MMKKSWAMMHQMYQTDKEHEEYKNKLVPQVSYHAEKSGL